MVAPHVEKPLTRSLVRVPNSGRDRSAGAVLHDLSRVSSAAAMVPITNYLALGLLSSALSPRPSSSQSPVSQSIMRKLAGVGTHQPSRTTGNGTMPRVNSGTNRPWSDPYPQVPLVPTTSGATALPRDHQIRGTQSRVRLSSGSTSLQSRGGRKRSLPASVRNGSPMTSPKVPRDTPSTSRSTQQHHHQHQQQQQQRHPILPGGVLDLVARPSDPQLRSLSSQSLHFQQTRPIEGM